MPKVRDVEYTNLEFPDFGKIVVYPLLVVAAFSAGIIFYEHKVRYNQAYDRARQLIDINNDCQIQASELVDSYREAGLEINLSKLDPSLEDLEKIISSREK